MREPDQEGVSEGAHRKRDDKAWTGKQVSHRGNRPPESDDRDESDCDHARVLGPAANYREQYHEVKHCAGQ